MLKSFGNRSKGIIGLALGIAILAAIPSFALIPRFLGGNNGGGNNFGSAVGGVRIDANGVVNMAPEAILKNQADRLRTLIKPGSSEIREKTEMRMVSLKGLEDAVKKAMKDGKPGLPEDIRFLAGLQRIEYVFLYPEQNDIVLAGPGEGWKVDDSGRIVGETSGMPVLHLDDLVVALRTVNKAREGYGISVSIDPTEAGRKAFDAVMRKNRRFSKNLLPKLEEALGQQVISLTGVPENSHYARVLVAADYKMKCIGMALMPSNVNGIPSYPGLLKVKRANPNGNSMPRWWMACNYQPLAKSADGLTWKLRGQGVKTMTEDDVIEDGKVKGSRKANKFAQEWADRMTDKYTELAVKDPVFGDLRNIMDMSVVAALIEKEGMLRKVGLKLPVLTQDKDYEIYQMPVPKNLPTQASVTNVNGQLMITASGGVQVDSWGVASKSEVDDQIASNREQTNPDDYVTWWWN